MHSTSRASPRKARAPTLRCNVSSVATCDVLRCPNAAVDVLNLMPPTHMRLEVAICQQHLVEVRAGVPYRYDPDQHILLVGKDINSADMRLITAVPGWSVDVATVATDALRIEIAYENGEPGQLLMSRSAIRELIEACLVFDPTLAPGISSEDEGKNS
jgi:hypothetical protein